MAVTRAAASSVQARLSKQVVSMFRKMCRDIPKVLVMYNLEQTPSEARHMLMLQFRKAGASAPNDPRITEMMIDKARQEFEETMQQWKQKGHLMAILQPELAAPDFWTNEEELFRRFLDGTLTEEDVWAGWDQRKMMDRLARVKAIEQQRGSTSDEVARADALLLQLGTSHLQ